MRTGSEIDTCPIKVSEYVLGCAGMTKRQAQPSSAGTESTDASPFPWSERSQQREQTRECSVPAPRDPGSQLPCVFMGANVFSFSLAPAWAGISISWHRVSLHMLRRKAVIPTGTTMRCLKRLLSWKLWGTGLDQRGQTLTWTQSVQ